ncbi:fatty acid cis/trans isomerase, partial [Poseidonibacter ostreae]
NNKSIKHKVSARYIYEHLFLAHISFDDKSENFYELVRSKTPNGKSVEIIATKFPYDEIKEEFFYRFRKIESTIVHKTHMVYKLNDSKLLRFNELFINPKWDIKPYLASYDKSISANGLKVFEQIPAISRYEFMLDNIHYIIMTFIRGPVCKGQVALNVIQDHFWVMFMDPKYDVSLHDKFYLHDNLKNLFIPNQYGDNPSIFKTTSILDNYDFAKEYQSNKSKIYKQYYPKGLDINSIWKGNKKEENDSILTIYRHFDSASVHKGALGNIPKTLWVIDYPLLERIYYSLVAGFDVFGNTPHQLLVRKHMDRLRIEGESNFLEYLPKESRKEYFNSWYQGWLASQLSVYVPSEVQSSIDYKTDDFKEEFVQKVFDYTKTKKDSINFIEKEYIPMDIKEKYTNKEEIEETFKSLTLPNSSQIIKTFTDSKSNLAHIRIKMNDKKDLVYSMIINRWHKNVALLFSEESRLDSSKDTVNYRQGFIGSYPNVYVEVKQDDLSEFFNLLKNYKNNEVDKKKILKFVINRANPNFWKSFDWFNNKFKTEDSLNYGLMDLNRYISKAIND